MMSHDSQDSLGEEYSQDSQTDYSLPDLKRAGEFLVDDREPKRQRTELENREAQVKEGTLPPQTFQNTSQRRRLVRQIKHFKAQNPKLDVFAINDTDRQLAHMDEDELRAVLDNIRDQLGGVSVFASSISCIKVLAPMIENALKRPGLSQALINDMDLISAIDDLLPERINQLGTPIQLISSFVQAYTNAPVFAKAPEKQNGAADPPIPPTSDREVPNGQDDIHRSPDSH